MKFGLVGIKRGKRFYFLFCCFVCLGFFFFFCFSWFGCVKENRISLLTLIRLIKQKKQRKDQELSDRQTQRKEPKTQNLNLNSGEEQQKVVAISCYCNDGKVVASRRNKLRDNRFIQQKNIVAINPKYCNKQVDAITSLLQQITLCQ